jgi:hypothetical protein
VNLDRFDHQHRDLHTVPHAVGRAPAKQVVQEAMTVVDIAMRSTASSRATFTSSVAGSPIASRVRVRKPRDARSPATCPDTCDRQ